MPYKNKEKQKKYCHDYGQKNKEAIKKKHQVYYSKPEIKDKKEKYEKYYYHTPRGKERRLSASKRWRDNNLEKARKYSREYARNHPIQGRITWLRRKYGITLETYQALYDSQNGLCAICSNPEASKNQYRTKKLSVDHNHETGKIRGLLCHKCNAMIGYSKENLLILNSAIDYLQKHQ